MSDRCSFWNLEESYLLQAYILTWHSTDWQGFEITSLPLSRYSQRPSDAIILFQYQTKHSPCTQQAHGSPEKLLMVTLYGPLIRCAQEVQEQLEKKSLVWVQGRASPSRAYPFILTMLCFQQSFPWSRQTSQELAQENPDKCRVYKEWKANGCLEKHCLILRIFSIIYTININSCI